MTRQVAIAALVAFAATVLVLSIWEPKPAPPPPPAPNAPRRVVSGELSIRRGERFGAAVASPRIARQLEAQLQLLPVDAGAP